MLHEKSFHPISLQDQKLWRHPGVKLEIFVFIAAIDNINFFFYFIGNRRNYICNRLNYKYVDLIWLMEESLSIIEKVSVAALRAIWLLNLFLLMLVIGLVFIDEVRIVTSLFKRFINFILYIIILLNFRSIKKWKTVFVCSKIYLMFFSFSLFFI